MYAERFRLPLSADQGFTLIEILVALIIFALAFGAIAQSFQISLRQTVSAETLLSATALAERQLADAGITQSLSLGGGSGLSQDGLQWRTSIELAAPISRDLDIALYRIEVEVGPEDGSPYVTLQSLRMGAAP